MTFYGHKTAFVAVMLSFGLFVWSWNCYMVKPFRTITLKHGFVIGDFVMKSNFDNTLISVLVGMILPILIIIATKVFLVKKFKKEKTKKLN